MERSNTTFTGLVVSVGVEREATLKERVAMLPGIGQLWWCEGELYVMCRWDVAGRLVWSVVMPADAGELIRLYNPGFVPRTIVVFL